MWEDEDPKFPAASVSSPQRTFKPRSALHLVTCLPAPPNTSKFGSNNKPESSYGRSCPDSPPPCSARIPLPAPAPTSSGRQANAGPNKPCIRAPDPAAPDLAGPPGQRRALSSRIPNPRRQPLPHPFLQCPSPLPSRFRLQPDIGNMQMPHEGVETSARPVVRQIGR